MPKKRESEDAKAPSTAKDSAADGDTLQAMVAVASNPAGGVTPPVPPPLQPTTQGTSSLHRTLGS